MEGNLLLRWHATVIREDARKETSNGCNYYHCYYCYLCITTMTIPYNLIIIISINCPYCYYIYMHCAYEQRGVLINKTFISAITSVPSKRSTLSHGRSNDDVLRSRASYPTAKSSSPDRSTENCSQKIERVDVRV